MTQWVPALMMDPSELPAVTRAEGLALTLRQASAGDAGAWRDLVEAYTPRVFGLLQKQCRDRELAEELTQATFVRVVSKLGDFSEGSGDSGGYDERGRFEPWLFRIAMNLLRDEMRRRKRHAQPMEEAGLASGRPRDGSAGPLAPPEVASRAEEVARVEEAVSRLPEADRRVLHLRHTAGLSFAEIAQTLDQPLGTVLARAHRALGKLRKMLNESETPRPGKRAETPEQGGSR